MHGSSGSAAACACLPLYLAVRAGDGDCAYRGMVVGLVEAAARADGPTWQALLQQVKLCRQLPLWGLHSQCGGSTLPFDNASLKIESCPLHHACYACWALSLEDKDSPQSLHQLFHAVHHSCGCSTLCFVLWQVAQPFLNCLGCLLCCQSNQCQNLMRQWRMQGTCKPAHKCIGIGQARANHH